MGVRKGMFGLGSVSSCITIRSSYSWLSVLSADWRYCCEKSQGRNAKSIPLLPLPLDPSTGRLRTPSARFHFK